MSRHSFVVLAWLLVITLLAGSSALADPITVSNTGTISTTSTTPTRLFRDGIISSCAGKTFPGPFSSGSFGYTVEGSFGPVASSSCITVTWGTGTCGTNVIPVAFLNSFDPTWGAANDTNYLGDPGGSGSGAGTFSFTVPAGGSFVLVFMNANSLAGCQYSYSFTYDGAGAAAAGGPECTLPVPEGSVVGDVPFNAQVYYEPGSASPGVLLNPGTYIVIGQDVSETYYQIVLACQYVWVLKSNVQPSYQPPQNGAALPTQIVDAPSGDTSAAGGANDLGSS